MTRPRPDGRNAGREVTTKALCQELGSVAGFHSIKFPFTDNASSLAQHLRQVMDTLRAHYEVTNAWAGVAHGFSLSGTGLRSRLMCPRAQGIRPLSRRIRTMNPDWCISPTHPFSPAISLHLSH